MDDEIEELGSENLEEPEQLPWKNESSEWGLAPPYGAYRGHYGDYQTAQYGGIGSGRMGGWTTVKLGGSFEDDGKDSDPERDR
jgi:hypothetical protein